MKAAPILIATGLCLAACNREPQVSATNASVAEVAEKVRKAGAGTSFVRPGQWESVVTIEQMDIPGMPAAMAGRMKSMMTEEASKASRQCLTQEDVKRPSAEMFAKGKQCRYDHFNMGGGKIDAVMRCGAGGTAQVMAMSGTYSPDRYRLTMSNQLQAEAKGATGALNMRMRIDAHRVGECDAKSG